MSTRLPWDRYLELIESDTARLASHGPARPRRRRADLPGLDGARPRAAHRDGVPAQDRLHAARRDARPADWPPPMPEGDPVDVLRAERSPSCSTLLRERGPDAPSATWLPEDQTVGFWYRRMAHEAAVHRVDAESAFGEITPVDARPRGRRRRRDPPALPRRRLDATSRPTSGAASSPEAGAGRTIEVIAGDHSWRVTLHPDRVDVVDGPGEAVATVGGDPSDVMLWLWRRRPDRAGRGGRRRRGGRPRCTTGSCSPRSSRGAADGRARPAGGCSSRSSCPSDVRASRRGRCAAGSRGNPAARRVAHRSRPVERPVVVAPHARVLRRRRPGGRRARWWLRSRRSPRRHAPMRCGSPAAAGSATACSGPGSTGIPRLVALAGSLAAGCARVAGSRSRTARTGRTSRSPGAARAPTFVPRRRAGRLRRSCVGGRPARAGPQPARRRCRRHRPARAGRRVGVDRLAALRPAGPPVPLLCPLPTGCVPRRQVVCGTPHTTGTYGTQPVGEEHKDGAGFGGADTLGRVDPRTRRLIIPGILLGLVLLVVLGALLR